MNEGILMVISGPSGAGKGTVLKEIKELPDVYYSISATTREKRPGEIDGEHYHFITRQTFEELIEQDGLIEYARYCDDYYGTPKKNVTDALAVGKVVILEIETEGAAQIRKKFPQSVLLFITPTYLSELRRRLIMRATETIEKIDKRVMRAQHEFLQTEQYDYIVINDQVEQAVGTIKSIIKAEQSRAGRLAGQLKNDIAPVGE